MGEFAAYELNVRVQSWASYLTRPAFVVWHGMMSELKSSSDVYVFYTPRFDSMLLSLESGHTFG